MDAATGIVATATVVVVVVAAAAAAAVIAEVALPMVY